ncbi:unnamed protein product [Jaminaea pallidilutea]
MPSALQKKGRQAAGQPVSTPRAKQAVLDVRQAHKEQAQAQAQAQAEEEGEEDEDESDEDDEDDEDDDDDDDDEDSESDEDSDNGGVSEKGMERLMKALGKDGLDEADLAQLAALRGEGDDEEDDEDEEEVSDEEDGASESEDDDEDEQAEADEAESAVAPTSTKDSLAASLMRSGLVPQAADDEDDEEEEDEEEEEVDGAAAEDAAVAVDSLDDSAFAALPDSVRSRRFHREKTNNRPALMAVRDSIALDPSSSSSSSKPKRMDWIEHMSTTWDKSVEAELEAQGAKADDDLKRELVFYRQALAGAISGRRLVHQANVPFTRPDDFYAEMVKSDVHMERIRQRLLDERAGIAASEEAKRQRELKKFGKKVQVEKGLERQREKREMEDKIKGLKRKRGAVGEAGAGAGGGDDEFDIQIANALDDDEADSKRARGGDAGRGGGGAGRGRGGGRMPRSARDDKYGFGGKKRYSKSNTKESTEAGYGKYQAPSKRGGKRGGKAGGAKRPGKNKRAGH